MSRPMIALLSIGIFLISLTQKVFATRAMVDGEVWHYEIWYGFEIFMFGWLGPLGLAFGWYANIILIFALYYLGSNLKYSAILSSLGFLLALSSLLFKKMFLDERWAPYSDVVEWSIGFYLWLLCFLVLAIGSSYLRFMENNALKKYKKSFRVDK